MFSAAFPITISKILHYSDDRRRASGQVSAHRKRMENSALTSDGSRIHTQFESLA
jgi:hypothetical protein